jgi:hypothetical protein
MITSLIDIGEKSRICIPQGWESAKIAANLLLRRSLRGRRSGKRDKMLRLAAGAS